MNLSFSRPFVLIILLISLAMIESIHANEKNEPNHPKESTPPKNSKKVKTKGKNNVVGFVDYTHQTVSQSILLLTNRFDSFFGSERADDEANGSTIRLSWDHRKVESIEYENKVNLRMNLKFPALQEKLKFRFDKKEEKKTSKEDLNENKSDSKTVNQISKEQAENRKRIIDYAKYWNLRFEAGVRAEIPVNPFINLRVWRPYSGSFWEFNPTHEFFVFWDDGFGTRHSFNVDFKLTEKVLLRIENAFSWTDLSDTIRSTHGPSLFYKLSRRRAISFNAKAFGKSRPTYFINNYSLSATYRQLIYKKWLFFEVSPALSFPSSNDFERIASIFFKLETVFGSI